MTARHIARAIVLQTLFAADEQGALAQARREDLEADLARRLQEEEGKGGVAPDTTYARHLLGGILARRRVIDEVLQKAAPEWPLERLAPLDRNVLRLGLYELLFANHEEVPHKVAINEAVTLAREYGGPTSPRFVNGVLGTVYRELGEPGRDHRPTHKRHDHPSEGEDAPLREEVKVGAVVYARHNHELYLALVHDVFGYWTLSKGGVEEGEDLTVALKREIVEEIGVPVKVGPYLGEHAYVANHPTGERIRKRVHYFLAEAPFQELTLAQKGGLDEARWFRLSDVLDLSIYPDLVPILTRALQYLVRTSREVSTRVSEPSPPASTEGEHSRCSQEV